VFNSHVLCSLVKANEAGILNKMVVIQVASILEVALGQIIYRAQNYTLEGVPNISEADRAEIEGKKIDKLSPIIDVMKKYGALDALGRNVYEELHKLRKYRNKIHIQDKIAIAKVSPDEEIAFSDDICSWALEPNVRMLEHLNDHFPRPEHVRDFVNLLSVPKS